jgi:glycosyltransferase involved in cell wall biosynthesis
LPYFQVYRLFQKSLLREFEQTLKGAQQCAVIGESMKRHYDKTYGTKSIIVRHGVNPQFIDEAAESLSTSGPIRIGFIGSVTAASAFRAFWQALDEQGWKIGEREIHLRLAGHRFDLRCHSPAHIEYLGWQSVEDSIRMLSECDINYLPQPFESSQQALAEWSFPTKLTSYLAAGRPILLHAPAYASLNEFLQKHPFGINVDSLDTASILAGLRQLIDDPILYANCSKAGQRAMNEAFTDETFCRAFKEFIGSHAKTLSQEITGERLESRAI